MVPETECRLAEPDLDARNCAFLSLRFRSQLDSRTFAEIFPTWGENSGPTAGFVGRTTYSRNQKQHMLRASLSDIDLTESKMVRFCADLAVHTLSTPLDSKIEAQESLEDFFRLLTALPETEKNPEVDITASFVYPRETYTAMGFPMTVSTGPTSVQILGMRLKIQDPEKPTYSIILDTTPEGHAWHNVSLRDKLKLDAGMLTQALEIVADFSKGFVSKSEVKGA